MGKKKGQKKKGGGEEKPPVASPDHKGKQGKNSTDNSENMEDEGDGFFVMQSKKGRKQKAQEREVSAKTIPEDGNVKKNKAGKKWEARTNQIEEAAPAYSHQEREDSRSKMEESVKPPVVIEQQQTADFPVLEFTTQQGRKKRKGKGASQVVEKASSSDVKSKPPPALEPVESQPSRKVKQSEYITDISVSAVSQSLSTLELKSQNKNQQSFKKRQSDSQQAPVQTVDTAKKPTAEGSKESYELIIPSRKTRSGTKGRPITIETNHLALSFKNLTRAVHYDVTITPNTPKKLFRQSNLKSKQPENRGVEKQVAGIEIITNEKSERLGEVYSFPKCFLSEELLRKAYPNLSKEAMEEDHLVIVAVR